ncbi:RagB/SusD family nutrient uptake outer membrane protein [Flavihumibacter sp. UBA7668]|uniref:RagB/SusD family nutrient uptake outer membrane protein n=1 Tax=Flavihumibacter sp. UBA7668 TaxID=1946542 RepID=UPI0025BF9642|nr:RagB/SusD family nutrient uptake outer membrane protein [Flavihumibacter sp. UBA7668]
MKKICFIFSCVLLLSCHKELDKFPLDAPSSATFLRTEAELKAALVGCYSPLNLRFGENPYIHVFDMFSDIATNRDVTPHAMWSTATTNYVNNIWNTMYQIISRCNFLLENVSRVTTSNTALVTQATGEAKFLRAYCYSLLSDFYGGVPLVTTTLNLSDAFVSKNSKAEVVDFILKELNEAADMLQQTNQPNTMVVSKGAAWAIASRVALYNERWADAATAASNVMALEGSEYLLHPNYADITMRAGKTSKEVIWAIQFNYNDIFHETPLTFRSRMAGGFSNRMPVQSLVDSYDCIDGLSIDQSPLYDPAKPFANRDPRLAMTIALPGTTYYGYQFETHKDSLQCWNYNVSPAVRVANLDATHTFASFSGYCWRKYADPKETHTTRSDINPIVIRYAEVLLNYAEAKIEGNQVDETVYAAINKVRQRVGMPVIEEGKSIEELRSIVRKERKAELAGEGSRYFDILRWKIAEEVLSGPCYGRVPRGYLSSAPVIDENGTPDYSTVANRADMRVIQTRIFNAPTNYVWPIPDIEIQTNKNLVQNDGY